MLPTDPLLTSTGDWILETTPVIGLFSHAAFDVRYILADILRCSYNEVKFSQRWSFLKNCTVIIFTRSIQPNCVGYEFNIFLTLDFKKRWSDLHITPSTEYWNCKVAWFLVSQVECWLLNLHFVYITEWDISGMLRDQFSRTSDHVNVGSLSWFINFECWNVELKVGCYNLMLLAEVESWVLKLIDYLAGIEHHRK